ncbi:hypothetical protein CJ204_04965 [Corynebacterium xerosis]|uniref:DUF2254 domain-containing protein n=2 Tax=Corynebacterium xerosis TaxID=1725 RepID=A0A2N6SZN3_9CORY|nr:hypothetical protein CJ204_04965 [Corynebacterium xerosis]
MLSFVSSTTLTVLTTTISMRLIVLQVASGNFSHQLLRDYIQSRAVRGILAVYVGAVAYSITLQRSMDADAEFVPQLAMTVAMLLITMSLATFIWYVSRVVDMVRVDAIIDGTVRQTVANIDERIEIADCLEYEPRPLVPANARTLVGDDHGYVLSVDVGVVRQTLRILDTIEDVVAEPADRGATAHAGNGDTELGHGGAGGGAEVHRRGTPAHRQCRPAAHPRRPRHGARGNRGLRPRRRP